MALTKADFAEQLFDELGLNKSIAKDLVELFFEEIKATLEQGGAYNSAMKARALPQKKTEARISASALNRMTSLGMPVSVKI